MGRTISILVGVDRSQYIDYLRRSALFQGIDLEALAVVAASSRPHRIKKGAYFFYQDQPAKTLYMLVEGRVKFTQVTAEGQQVLLRAIGPGEIFGTVAALGDAMHPASAQASTDCTALAWREEVIAGLMERFPRIALNVARFLAGRLKEFQDRYRELATERVERRVARTLLRLARQLGMSVAGAEDERVLIDLALTRQDIAEMSGTTLFTVSRILSGWQHQGIVRTGRERVVICSSGRLLAIAEDQSDLPPH